MRKSIVCLTGLLMLQGCAQPLTPKIEIVEVTKEVYVPCIRDTPVSPVYLSDNTPKSQPAHEKVKALLVDRLLSKTYIAELEAVVQGCKQ